MRLLQLLTYGIFASSAVSAVSVPEDTLDRLAAHGGSVPRSLDLLSPEQALEKRKGGGGKGGGGGGGGGGKSGGGGGSSRTSTTSSVGGSTKAGSGPVRSYGGGYYGGGASIPYQAGKPTTRGLSPGLLLFPAAGFLIFPGLWLYNVYPYQLNSYRFYNATARNDTERNDNQKRQESNETMGRNETLPVTCLCQEYQVCGCENNDNPQYLNDLVGNGSYAALNQTLVTVAEINGTRTLYINGSLPNGTTAPGGEDDMAAGVHFTKYSACWLMGWIFVYTVAFL